MKGQGRGLHPPPTQNFEWEQPRWQRMQSIVAMSSCAAIRGQNTRQGITPRRSVLQATPQATLPVHAGDMAADLNPAFVFDLGGFGGGDDAGAQAPWELGGAPRNMHGGEQPAATPGGPGAAHWAQHRGVIAWHAPRGQRPAPHSDPPPAAAAAAAVPPAGALAQAETTDSKVLTSIDQKIASQLKRNERLATAQAAGRKAAAAAKPAKPAGRGRQAAAPVAASSEEEDESDAGSSGDDDDDNSDAPLPGEEDEGDDDSESDVQLALDGDSEEEDEEEGSEDEIARAGMELDSDELDSSDGEEDLLPVAMPAAKRKRGEPAQPPAKAAAAPAPRRGAAGAADAAGGEAQQRDAAGGKRQNGAAAGAEGGKSKGFFDAAPKDTKFSAKVGCGMLGLLDSSCQRFIRPQWGSTKLPTEPA